MVRSMMSNTTLPKIF
jgi:hypothetical protein